MAYPIRWLRYFILWPSTYFHPIHHVCGQPFDCNHCLNVYSAMWDWVWGTLLLWEDVPMVYKEAAVQELQVQLNYPEWAKIPDYDEICASIKRKEIATGGNHAQ